MTIITATIAITAAVATRHLNLWTVAAPLTLATIAITPFQLQRRIHQPSRTNSTQRTTADRRAGVLRFIAIASTVALAIGVPARWTFAAITQPQNPVVPNASLQALAAPTVQQQTIARNDAHLLRYATQHRGTAPLVLATPRITDSAQLVITGGQSRTARRILRDRPLPPTRHLHRVDQRSPASLGRPPRAPTRPTNSNPSTRHRRQTVGTLGPNPLHRHPDRRLGRN